MSDRYLCKAKRTDNGEWVEGNLLKLKTDRVNINYMYYIIPEITNGSWCKQNFALKFISPCYEIDHSTICQYTGLTDKNGKMIWEGDILSAHLDDEYPDDVTYVEIKWNGFSWCIRESTEDDVMTEYDCNIFEVCGNIFDNPELLGGTE